MFAQNLAYYHDKRDQFWVFDDGMYHKIDHLPARDVRLGGDYLIYTNRRNEMVFYKRGQTKMIEFNVNNSYMPTNYFMFNQQAGGGMQIIHDEQRHKVALGFDIDYALGDSIFAYKDFDRYLKAYTNDGVEEITNQPLIEFKVSDNSVGYTTESEMLYLFHEGEEVEIADRIPNAYYVGNNFLVYLSPFNDLMVYDAGETHELSSFYPPKSSRVGNNIAAFVTDEGYFKVYWNGETQELLPFPPKEYRIVDNTLMYVDDRGFLHVFYKGENIVLEAYTPKQIKMFDGIVAYVDIDGRLKGFYEGEKMAMSDRVIETFTVMGRVVLYEVLNGETRVFFEGKNY
ncbi:MAG: hypothetical protein AB8B69_17695 [Chitinophagales bacterium]